MPFVRLEASARPYAAKNLSLVIIASLAFATSSPLARVAVGLSPIGVACGRTAVAATAIFLAMPRATVASIRALGPKPRARITGAGVLLAAHFALYLGGLATTSFAAAVALVSLEPLAVVLTAWIAFGLRPTRREAIGIALATAGALVVSGGAGHGEHRLLGDAMVVGAVVVYGAYVAAARGLRETMPGLPYACCAYGAAAITLAIPAFALAAGGPAPPLGTWVAVVLLGLIPTLVGHTMIQVASRHASPSVVALVSPGETVGSLALGAIVLHTTPDRYEAAGALLVILGATLAIFRTKAESPLV